MLNSEKEKIDWNKAKELYNKEKEGREDAWNKLKLYLEEKEWKHGKSPWQYSKKYISLTSKIMSSVFSNQQTSGKPLTIKDEGVLLSESVESVDFTGTGIAVTAVGDNVTVDITGGGAGAVDSVFSRTGVVVATAGDYTASDVGLGNVDNTADTAKPVSTAQQTALNLKLDDTQKGAANGLAELDAGSKVPTSQLPTSVLGDVSYQGTWNASTNTPALTSGAGTKGFYYTVSVTGSTTLNGISDWKVTDMAIFNGTIWEKVDNTNDVNSVAGKTGTVTLDNSDVGLGNVDNTADTAKPVSTAQQTALNLKANLASPALTGTPTAPTQSASDNSTKLATTAYTDTAVSGAGGFTQLASDPASPSAGDSWFNTTSNLFKGAVAGAGAWSAGGSLNTASNGLAGCGTQSAGLSFGGYAAAVSAVTEEYNGTSWSAGGNLATARFSLAGCGTQSAGLSFGGNGPTAVTEEYNPGVTAKTFTLT